MCVCVCVCVCVGMQMCGREGDLKQVTEGERERERMAGRGDSILAHPSLKCLPPEDIFIYKVAQSCGNSALTPF